jgi:NADH-quinone oxidoreductase subunit G
VANVIIDGKQLEVALGSNLFEACTLARGELLPHFCYHPGLSIAGVCRMCQVEIEGMPKLQIACNTPVKDGMVVRTRSEKVKTAVQQILEFHLLHHPVDCPVCDQAGECALQEFYMDHGLYHADVDVEDKLRKAKVKPIGRLVMLDAERCVLCARCTRFLSEITGTWELGIFNRGDHSEIDVTPGMTLDNNYSLNTVDICPVGALTSRDFRFRKRVWWLKVTDSVCAGCATGCNMTIHHDQGVAYRFKPRTNPDVNRWWMCDHGRLLYTQIAGPDRLRTPWVRSASGGEPAAAGFDQAYRRIAAWLEQAGPGRKLVLVASPHAMLEEQYALQALLGEQAGGRVLGYRLAGAEQQLADGLLLSADRTPNAAGARRLGMAELSAADLQTHAAADTLLVILDNDLAGLSPEAAQALTGFGLVVYLGTRLDATARLADVTLPGLVYAEKDGLFVNAGGRVQALHAALPAPGEAKPQLALLRDLGELLGHLPAWSTVDDVRSALVARVAAFGALAGGVPPAGLALDAPPEDAAAGAKGGSKRG